MKSPEILFTEAILDITTPNGILRCVPEDAEKIFCARARTQAYYDEQLFFYLIVRLSSDSGINDHASATSFFQQLEVFAEASLIDGSVLSAPSPTPPPVYRLPPGRSRSNSNTNSPTTPTSPLPAPMDKKMPKVDGTVIYSYVYNPKAKDREMLVLFRNECWCCIVPLAVPVAYVKTRAQSPALALTAVVSQRAQVTIQKDPDDYSPYSNDNFTTVNLLQGLSDDPSFDESTSSLILPTSRIRAAESKRQNTYPNYPMPARPQPIKRSTRKVLPVKSALNVRMRTTSVSPLDNVLMMSVELENNTDAGSAFEVEAVKVEIANGIVTKYDWGLESNVSLNQDKFPLTLHPVDQVTFLYSITILEETVVPKNSPQFFPPPNPYASRASSRRSSIASVFSSSSTVAPTEDRQRHVSIVVRGSPALDGIRSRSIESRWNCMLDLSNLRRRDDSMPPQFPGIPGYNQRLSMQFNTMKTPTQAATPSRPGSIFSPGAMTPTPTKGTFSAGSRRTFAGLPTIPDNDVLSAVGNGILAAANKKNNDVETSDGVVVSFSVESKVIVGKIFTIQVFIVNRSKHVRRFTVVVPNRRRPNDAPPNQRAMKHLPPLPAGGKLPLPTEVLGHGNSTVEAFMEEAEFLKRYLEFETNEADIICLENNVRIGPLNPSTCESLSLHFIAVRESLHVIDLVQLVDNDTGFITNLRNVLEIFVGKGNNNSASIK
ncbi:13440_t:CDS:2 [Ambispora leptoticha]|uniref:13440_t:CDS:1 n=1 Tax=Ambispora leptoticha TaxID=144679 RepID=A0A9N9F268_9GLOM|nr:13440_t:CDS:2 [Ambispora leptoticha]